MKPNPLPEALLRRQMDPTTFCLKYMPNFLQTISERKIRVYIAGPLTADIPTYIKNVHKMMEYAEKLRKGGYAVYIPCLDLLQGVVWGDYEFEDYYDNSLAFLEVCDIVFVCPGWESSKGTRNEINHADELGIKVVYSIAEL